MQSQQSGRIHLRAAGAAHVYLQRILTTFDERERGSLEAGKIADMVLLDRNPYDIPKEELASVKVKQLYLRGQEYKKETAAEPHRFCAE